MELTAPIRSIKGVGAKTEQLFQKTGVYTIGDILFRFPREYTRYPKAVEISEAAVETNQKQAVLLRVERPAVMKSGKSMQIVVITGRHSGAVMEFVWFRMPYVRSTLKNGETFVLYGTVQNKGGKLQMEQPVIYTPNKYNEIAESLQPVYGLTAGLSNNLYKKTLRQVLEQDMGLSECFPAEILNQNGLLKYRDALLQIHFPESFDALTQARRRFVFEEFFFFLLAIQKSKKQTRKIENGFEFKSPALLKPLLEKLPYKLTDAQMHVLEDIQKDLHGPYVMQRLLQGDVGSGKTIIAFLAMYLAAASGYQSAIMAPTEVLARQHYETYTEYCKLFGIKAHIVLLTGSMTARQKRSAYESMQLFTDAMVIGTHALIQERAVYDNLALVITDEQHRFGVRQRETLTDKGTAPHVLVMSATPIPRTLAVILYGDLDISVIDQLPAKRLPIKNCVVGMNYREKSYEFIVKQVQAGHQAYVICPLVEPSESVDGESVIEYGEKLKQVLPKEIVVGILHGKMRPEQKNQIMEAFASNEIQVLVSTTVVEVGVNVPNATVIMIEDAQRFGLAQLHQLRGRVGRGDAQSYCILLNTSDAKEAGKRLEVLTKTNDGFQIASEDLKLRGPGDFFGIRQSGDMQFRLADIYQDATILQQASKEVKKYTEQQLELPENKTLKERLEQYLGDRAQITL